MRDIYGGKHMYQNRGNALFLILIAVALFAALSYAITQTSRGGGNAAKEQALIHAAQLTQYGSTIANAMMRMGVLGVTESEFCFNHTDNHADYNHAACSDTANQIFHVDGGGVTYQDSPAGMNDGTEWEYTSVARVWGAGTTDTPAVDANADLIMVLRNVNQAICTEVNNQVGISGIPEDSGGLDVARFDGAYTQVDNIDGCPANCASLAVSPIAQAGSNAFCIEEGDTNTYMYVHVLLAR